MNGLMKHKIGKKGAFGAGLKPSSMQTLIYFVIMLVLFLGILSKMIPRAAKSYHNFSDEMSGQGEVIGTDAAAMAGESDDWLGYLWFAIPFLLVLGLLIGKKRGMF